MADDEAAAAKRTKHDRLPCATVADTTGVMQQEKEDVAHLEGLDPSFACTVNLVLSAQDKDQTVKFPVHKDVVSGYSPILCQFIGELPPADTSTPHLPLVGDGSLAVHDVLAQMYATFRTSKQPASTSAPPVSLADWSILLDRLCFAHKYSMFSIGVAQEESLMVPLTQLVNGPYDERSSSLVLHIATVAQGCKCQTILALCEAFVVKHFGAYAAERQPEVVSKLSQTSLFRVSQGLLQQQAEAMQFAEQEFKKCALEAHTCSHAMPQPATCPRCQEPLEQSVHGAGFGRQAEPVLEFAKHRTASACQWPNLRAWTKRCWQVTSMAQHLQLLAAAQG